jgi:predicted nucleotidyltransferase
MATIDPKLLTNYINLTYQSEKDSTWEEATNKLMKQRHLKKVDLVHVLEDGVKANPPTTNDERLRFLTRIPLPRWWEAPFHDILVKPLADAKIKLPQKTSQWGQEIYAITAGILDFPRKKLPESVWKYEDDEPLPRLQPKLRALILNEARYRLSKFGAKIKGAMLYGGAATFQYHEGADIDCSIYVDWDDFEGDEELLQSAFKSVEIPWEGFVIHLFVKPSDQQEQVEVADASYNVLKDEWALPPLILPRDFDPNIYFAPMLEMAEKKAQKIDKLLGRVTREWAKLKTAVEARKEGPRDPEMVEKRVILQKVILKQEIDRLVEVFAEIWVGRKKMHDALRQKFVDQNHVDRFIRFQPPEVMWKYLDESGYVEYLKLLAKAHEEGVIDKLLDSI